MLDWAAMYVWIAAHQLKALLRNQLAGKGDWAKWPVTAGGPGEEALLVSNNLCGRASGKAGVTHCLGLAAASRE